MLELVSLYAGYDDLQVLWSVSLRVEAGEIVALLGANGAGKTTLLRAISGVIKPVAGRIFFEGDSIEGLPAHEVARRGISHVPEGRHVFTSLTVQENLEIAAATPSARARRRQTLEQVYELFPDLATRRYQPAGILSGGQQQMLAIGRGLMACPRLLMLDEPSQGLAPALVQTLFETIAAIRQMGISVLLVEQNVMAALTLADRAYLLQAGHIVRDVPAKHVLEDQDLRRVFLGR